MDVKNVKRAFTLIELLIVVAIIAILAGPPFQYTLMSAAQWIVSMGNGEIAYDPTNGTVSDGDLMRTSKGELYPHTK